MKKLLLILFVMVVASGLSLGAQDLTDNPDYRKSVELNAKAAQSFSDGDYDAATDYANQAKRYAALSDQYIATMVAKAAADKEMGKAKTGMAWADSNGSKVFYPSLYKVAADLYASAQASYAGEDYPTAGDQARNTVTAVQAIAKADADEAIAKAKAGLSDAEAIAAPANYPKEYAEAKGDLSDAVAAYDGQDFITAAQKARASVAALAMVKAKAPSWPAVYVVRLIPSHRDCLWRIAGYSFIYNDPLEWRVIYEANKKTFRDPGDPNLIFPGQKLQIPSIKGETRDGTFDPSVHYDPFPNK
jgi:nucleoid-associated protein YgaU